MLATTPTTALRRAWATNKPLTGAGVATAAVLVIALAGLVADPEVITGAPAWLKPAKFAVSIALYSFTFLWLLTYVRGHDRPVRLVSWVTALALAVEMLLIAGAAAFGTTSHFNVSSPLHVAVWSTMAGAIVAAWLANLAAAVLLLRQRFADAALAWSLRLGVLISAAGMGVAFLMTSPTAEQLAAAHGGAGLPVSGAHTVGAPDGGPGVPVLGWSTVGGDLRVPHFLGLHGLQVLPVLGALLTRYAPAWLAVRDRVVLVVTAGAAYLALVALTTLQALHAQPLTRPDAPTLAGLAAITGTAVAATTTVVLRARRVWRRPQWQPV